MPAAAAILAPIAYIKVVAFKKLVVGFRNGPVGPPQGELLTGLFFFTKTGKNFLLTTFDRAHFQHHSTYHSKALKEYFQNIHSFMIRKRCIFQLESLIIIAVFLKYWLNSLQYDIY